jgi:predicted nucleic acid-binding protein
LTLIVDASVALKWVIDEPDAETAAALLTRSMMAPDLFQAEIGHALTKRVRRSQTSPEQAQAGFAAILSRVSLLSTRSLGASALNYSIVLRHTIYDCFYLAMAEASGRPFVTSDGVFVRKLRESGRGGLVYLLGEELPVG